MKDLLLDTVEIIKKSRHITAFTGAGISVESGIPPFRGENGLWNKYNPEVLDLSYFYKNPKQAWTVIQEIFYDFFGKANPNSAHKVIARMEKEGLLKAVITQNIDNLHQEAGSKEVYEFHGTAQTLVCVECGNKYHSEEVNFTKLPPLCSNCSGLLKPDFIFFGEGIPMDAYEASFKQAQVADVFLIIGTTGEVMPASMIPQEAKRNGAKIIEINPEKSLYTNVLTDIFLQGKAGEIMIEIEKLLLNL